MRTLRLIFKLLPVIGDFIQNVKETEEKDTDHWIVTGKQPFSLLKTHT